MEIGVLGAGSAIRTPSVLIAGSPGLADIDTRTQFKEADLLWQIPPITII
jgi:hypothetical protein